MADTRRCRFCGLTLDDLAPMGSELVDAPKHERRTKSHCPSPNCHWCAPCQAKRLIESKAAKRDEP